LSLDSSSNLFPSPSRRASPTTPLLVSILHPFYKHHDLDLHLEPTSYTIINHGRRRQGRRRLRR
jgi:hypothetical protein